MATDYTTGNLSLDIKYPFVSFAQNYFAQHGTYTWTSDPRTTGIIIADKYAINIGVAFQRPTIIVSRGPIAWSDVIRNTTIPGTGVQYTLEQERLQGNIGTHDTRQNATITNLINGSIRYSVLFKEGLPAESAASDLFFALAAYQEDFKVKKIHSIKNLRLGEERLVKTKSDKILTQVDIDLQFESQKTLRRGEKQSYCVVFIDAVEVFEGINYTVKTNGTQIAFNTAPALAEALTITYTDATTLLTVTLAALGTGDGTTTVFTIPDSGAVYGYFTWLSEFIVTGPGITSLTLTNNYPDGGEETISGTWFQADG